MPTDAGKNNEDVLIGQNAPILTTTTNETQGAIGDTLTDQGTLAGSTTGQGGTIVFPYTTLFRSCATDGTGAVYSSTGVAVTGDATYDSSSGTASGDNTATTEIGSAHV